MEIHPEDDMVKEHKKKLSLKKITQANRSAWNEVHPVHQKKWQKDFRKLFRDAKYTTLDDIESARLKKIGLKGKKVGQLCCNNGRELISLMKLGAREGVGFDISDEVIREARELAFISGRNCKFIRTDVYDIGKEHYGQFDLVYLTSGALTWLPDLKKFFLLIAKMLKKNGSLMIYELHPFVNMLACEYEEGFQDPLKIAYSYFKKEAWIDNRGIDYIGKSVYQSRTNISFSQTISSIMNSIIQSGIRITEFNEYPHDISGLFTKTVTDMQVPLSYILVGQKK
ncbi:MAG: class I SAM-dependent methyltransferase [bacterium]|nr:class I SAM-dependent methyltransferase [bacterium]